MIRTQYSREAHVYQDLEHADIVIAEFETTIEILARSLLAYGVAGEDIQTLMAQTRKNLRTHSGGWSDALRKKLDLPAWETLGAIRPIIIKKDYFAIGKSIAELALRPKTGVTIVAIYRDGLGTTIPTPNFVLAAGDVLHVIGSEPGQIAAKSILVGSEMASAINRL